MSLFDFDNDNPDLDAAEIGGIIGFAEESLEIEDTIFNEDDSELKIDNDKLPFNLRIFKAQHPLLFNEVVKSVIRYHKHRKKIKDTRDEILANEFYYELEEMSESEEEI